MFYWSLFHFPLFALQLSTITYSYRKNYDKFWSRECNICRMALDHSLIQKLDGVDLNYNMLLEKLSSVNPSNDRDHFVKLSQEKSHIESLVLDFNEWKRLDQEIKCIQEFSLEWNDVSELKGLAEIELDEMLIAQAKIEARISGMLFPKDPNDGKNIIVEVRGGTGGDEASLWALDLVSMYIKYADRKKWMMQMISESFGDHGGYKSCSFKVSGKNVFSTMKHEVGM